MSKLAHSNDKTMAIISARAAKEAGAPCPDCDDKTFIHMLGEEYPCPTCQPAAYEEQCRERRLDGGQFGAGA